MFLKPRPIRASAFGFFSAPVFVLATVAQLLFCFFVSSVFAAKAAKLAHFQTVGVVLLVLHRVVIALLALSARKGYFNSQFQLPPK